MKIITCYKLSPDSRDLQVKSDYSISFDRAEWLIGDFDLVAIEAGGTMAKGLGAEHVGLSVGTKDLANTKARKNALARGLDSLAIVMDDALANADTNKTANVIAAAVKKIGDCRVVVCGEGSADYYYQQVGMQVGEILGLPVINGIGKMISIDENKLVAERYTEEFIETVEIPLPAVVTVTADFTQARIPQLKEILAAGKKPVEEIALADLGNFESRINIVNIAAPKSAERKCVIIDAPADEAAATLREYLAKEGLA